jgi:signal transduction histidine kinase
VKIGNRISLFFRRKNELAAKLTLRQGFLIAFAVIIAVILTFFCLVIHAQCKARHLKEIDQWSMVFGNMLRGQLLVPLIDGDDRKVTHIMSSVEISDFDLLAVFDASNKVIFYKNYLDANSSLPLKQLQLQKKNIEKKYLQMNQTNFHCYIFKVQPLENAENQTFLLLGQSAERISRQIKSTTFILVIYGFLFYLFLLGSFYILLLRISRPIGDLNQTVKELTAGNYTIRSRGNDYQEIRQLAESFNTMAEKFAGQLVAIEKYSQNLEQMVEDRTVKLQEAMDKIRDKENKLNRQTNLNSLNALVSSIAHEINNPLTIISGNIQILETLSADEQAKKRLKSIQEAIDRIDTLISEINFFSSIENEVTLISLSFLRLLLNVIHGVVPRNIRVIIHGCSNDYINSNHNLLTICMENIILNAVQIIEQRAVPQGEIIIEYKKQAGFFYIVVEDNGGGIENISRIFEPFYTTFNRRKGLGLTFIYHALLALNGEIQVINNEKGAKISLKIEMLDPLQMS